MSFVVLVVLAELAAAAPAIGRELSTFAAASPRPRECLRTGADGPFATAWDRARHPGTRSFCRALARGYAALRTDPAAAARAAAEAAKALPGRSEPLVLEGRALVKLDRFDLAYERLSAGQRISPSSLNAPEALYAFGVAAFRTGRVPEALEAYRALAPRLELIDEPRLRQRVYVEAAMLAMSLGPPGLDESLGYLGEARRLGNHPGMSDHVLGALALALDRSGRVEEARGVALGADGPWRLVQEEGETPRTAPLNLPAGELHAMAAILAEHRDADLARRHWEAYVSAQPEGPFVSHARKKLGRLTRRGH